MAFDAFALVLRREGKLDEAEAHHREALACRRNILTGDRLPVAESLYNLAVVLRDAGKLAEDVLYTERGVTVRESRDLWDMPIVFLVLIGLLGADWGYGRRRGLA